MFALRAVTRGLLAVAPLFGLWAQTDPSAPIFQPGPTAHFTLSVQGQSTSDGGSVTVSSPSSGGVSAAMMSTSSQGGAPIVAYSWTANGSPLGCASASCTAELSQPSNTIALTVTDGSGQSSTAMAGVNLRVQSGPVARFTMTAAGRSASDGGTLYVPQTGAGSVSLGLSSSSTEGGAPITTYRWTVNGSSLPCAASGCTASISAPNNSIALTVTDSLGQSSTAGAFVRLGEAPKVDPDEWVVRKTGPGPRPVARFRMSAGDKSATDGQTLDIGGVPGGRLQVTFTAADPGAAAAYVWRVNTRQVCGNSPTCSLMIGPGRSFMTLTVLDSEGQGSITTGYLNISSK